MSRDRSQAIVVRGDRILMVKHHMGGRDFFCLPGGGIESGETPEEAALRELSEEARVEGEIVQKTSVQYKPEGKGRVYSFLVQIPEDAVAAPGVDPEFSDEEQTIVSVSWMKLEELSQIDQIYLWASGLNRVPVFYEKLNQMKK